MALYSASIENLEIVDCFFDFQETNESLIKMQYPVTDLLVSGKDAQFESLNPLTWNSKLAEMKTPFLGSFFK
uniref:Uncharacterized protein n=1 Tax=Quercus lobata TaxID=97700 RepID=A0A7N2REG5_QUELO